MPVYHQSHQQHSYGEHDGVYSSKPLHHPLISPVVSDRPPLTPLSLTLSARSALVESTHGSAPNTACTDGSGSGWPVYTPPGTATSGSGSGNDGSPAYSGTMPAYVKGEVADYYHHSGVTVGDLDPFSFNAGTEGIVNAGYHGHGRGQPQAHSVVGNSSYRDAGVVFSTVIHHSQLHSTSDDGCPQFAEDCGHGYYP